MPYVNVVHHFKKYQSVRLFSKIEIFRKLIAEVKNQL